ncbi:MAG: ABC transporter substrate-binding protein [Nitrospinota bacterium]|nr:ABC transporter substrate-binding protein [Nitrospinota bacterium]
MRIITAAILALLLFPGGFSWAADGPIRIGANLWPGYEPLFLAGRLYDWSGQSLARVKEYPSTSEVMTALKGGQIDAAGVTLDEALLLFQEGIKIKIILVLDHSNGGDALLARPELTTMQHLKGKRVAVENDALGGYMLRRALETAGMRKDEIKPEHKDMDQHEKAYKNGDVDAVVTFEPVRTKLLALGARELFSSAQIPGEISDVLVIREETMAQHADAIQKIVADWFRAVDYMNQNRDEVMNKFGQRMNLTARESRAAFDGLKIPSLDDNRLLLAGPNPALKKPMLMVMRGMVESSRFAKPKPLGNIITGEYLP